MEKRAWHAGVSEFKERKNCNDFSIGVELEGCDDELYEISCKLQVQNSIYVDHLLRVWPCCYLPNKKELVKKHSWYGKYFQNKSNNLLEKSLSEILEDDFYDTLQNSWTDKTTCLSKCKSTCTVTHKSGSFDASANYREKVW